MEVHYELQVPAGCRYPAHQTGPDVEAYFHRWWREHRPQVAAEYIPILWTNVYLRYGFGPQPAAQAVLDRLDPDKKYFTVVLNDDGILEKVPPNVKVFGCSAGDVPIPMLCDPHPVTPTRRDILASFIGKLDGYNNRTGVRGEMRMLAGLPDLVVSDESVDSESYRWLMQRSTFALCPRGYGRTSYRMYEAIQLGTIPVYIYDDPWLPYQDELDWSEFAVLCSVNQLPELPLRLRSFTRHQVASMQLRLKAVFPDYFTMEAMCRQIEKRIRLSFTHTE